MTPEILPLSVRAKGVSLSTATVRIHSEFFSLLTLRPELAI